MHGVACTDPDISTNGYISKGMLAEKVTNMQAQTFINSSYASIQKHKLVEPYSCKHTHCPHNIFFAHRHRRHMYTRQHNVHTAHTHMSDTYKCNAATHCRVA